jgi:hypothetical protein
MNRGSVFMNYHEPITHLELISNVFITNCIYYKRYDLAKESMIRVKNALLNKNALNDFEKHILYNYTRLIEVL